MPGPYTSTKNTYRRFFHRQLFHRQFLLSAIAILSAISVLAMQLNNLPHRSAQIDQPFNQPASSQSSLAPEFLSLLTDPFLQLPTDSSVQVVWFTEFEGTEHIVEYSDPPIQIAAVTTQLSRTREDSDSRVQGRAFPEVTRRRIWRHEATIPGLKPGFHLPYRVISRDASGQSATSNRFTLAPNPPPDRPLKILLTSDHQLKPMTPANLQKVVETVGRVDAVFFAGDLVNIPDRASEWFDDARGLAFFPGLQGRTRYAVETSEIETSEIETSEIETSEIGNGENNQTPLSTIYTGGELIQHAPIFPNIGNHEVMGRYAEKEKLDPQFANTLPRDLVSRFYPTPDGGTPSQAWIADHSYNTQTYEEIFSLPTTQLPDGGTTEQYYAVSFGNVRLISLYVTQIWRSPSLAPNTQGRYRERHTDLNNPEIWGYGQHIFEPIKAGSPQHQWLQQELAKDEFKNAKYKVVMLHHPPHTLGGNIVPAFTDPILVENRAADGTLKSVQYEYPKEKDYLIRDLVPLLESAGVQLVFYGHSHLWNRFVSPSGMNFLETSNVGNSYGAHLTDNPRGVPTNEAAVEAGLLPFEQTYSALGNPNGLQPVIPTLSPLTTDSGEPLPYIASNDITSFSILDTGNGTISSYYFDLRKPKSAVVRFDEFALAKDL